MVEFPVDILFGSVVHMDRDQENVLVGGFFVISGYVSAYTSTKLGERGVEEKAGLMWGFHGFPWRKGLSTAWGPIIRSVQRWEYLPQTLACSLQDGHLFCGFGLPPGNSRCAGLYKVHTGNLEVENPPCKLLVYLLKIVILCDF